MGQFKDLLNAIIEASLPKINSAIGSAIKSKGLDPMQHVASGHDKIGSIDLGICTAEAIANYDISNLNGLGSLSIDSIIIATATTSEDGSKMHGTVNLVAHLHSNIGIHVGGSFKAGCGFLKPSVGIGGSVSISSVSLKAAGDFEATIGDKICLTSIDITSPGLNYGNVNVDIDGLGVFNSLLHPLESFILGIVKGPITNTIEGALKPPTNQAIAGALPHCQSL